MNVLLLSKKIDIINKILPKESIIGFIPTAGEVYENPSWIEEDKNLAGGNVFWLKQQIEGKQLKETIIQFINNNKLYIGASAGSCLCAPSLELYQTLADPKKAT